MRMDHNINAVLPPPFAATGLAGKTALVTGSTSGIGLGIAQGLAAAGMNVVLNGYGEATAVEATRLGIERRHGVRSIYAPADLSRPAEVRAMVGIALATFSSVDVLVNNAGIQHVEGIETFPSERWDAIIAINLTAAFHAMRAVIPGMKTRRWGRIINLASAHGLVASPFKSAYVAAEHGIVGLTKAVALEAARHGITVNAICPGSVLTPSVEQQVPESARSQGMSEAEAVANVLLASQPTKQFVSVEQLSAFAIFLASDAAASITGTALPVDGGWTAH